MKAEEQTLKDEPLTDESIGGRKCGDGHSSDQKKDAGPWHAPEQAPVVLDVSRVGGELKFNTIMGRLGFAYYGNPYEEKSFKYGETDENTLKPRRMNISGGLGYRNRGIFVDLTYVHSLNRDVNFPYRLTDKDNTYAALKESNGTVLLTLGFKFR